MPIEILKALDWVDIVIAILLFRIVYVSTKTDIYSELFKVLGTIVAIYITFHYYTLLSAVLTTRLGLKTAEAFLNLICFIALTVLGYWLLAILRKFFLRFIKMEAIPQLNKWGGLLLGIVRGLMLSSILVFVLTLAPSGYLAKSVNSSFSGKKLFRIAPDIYSAIWIGFMSKFMPQESFNKSALDAEKALEPKK